jgi:hypothetical protein
MMIEELKDTIKIAEKDLDVITNPDEYADQLDFIDKLNALLKVKDK